MVDRKKSREYSSDNNINEIFKKRCTVCDIEYDSFVETCQECGRFLGRAIV